MQLAPSPAVPPSTVISVPGVADPVFALRSPHFSVTGPVGMKRCRRTRVTGLCSAAGGTGRMPPSAFSTEGAPGVKCQLRGGPWRRLSLFQAEGVKAALGGP